MATLRIREALRKKYRKIYEDEGADGVRWYKRALRAMEVYEIPMTIPGECWTVNEVRAYENTRKKLMFERDCIHSLLWYGCINDEQKHKRKRTRNWGPKIYTWKC